MYTFDTVLLYVCDGVFIAHGRAAVPMSAMASIVVTPNQCVPKSVHHGMVAVSTTSYGGSVCRSLFTLSY